MNISLVVSTDGSQASKLAFYVFIIFLRVEQAVEFFEHQNLFNKLIVSHISDQSKTYLPFEYESSTIQEDYRIELLSRYPAHKYQLIFEQKNLISETVRDQLLEICQIVNAGYLMIGYSGRKGIKGQKQRVSLLLRNATILGQTVLHCAYNSKIPLMITKEIYKRNPEKEKGFTFLVCLDGSQKSYECLNCGVQLAFDKYDKILICYAPTPDNKNFTNTIKQKVEKQMENVQREWEFLTLPTSYQDAQSIIDYINLNDQVSIEFVLFGANGYRAQLQKKIYFGHFAQAILTKAKANPIIVP